MKQPCCYCKKSRWLHDPNDYTLPTFSHCDDNLQPEDGKCYAGDFVQKGVADMINDNIKKYKALGRA